MPHQTNHTTTTGAAHHWKIFGMVSERLIDRRGLHAPERVEQAVMLELWLQANDVRIVEKFRSLRLGDEHKVALVEHPTHGRVMLKTVSPSQAKREWWEYHLYRAIRAAQQELAIDSFVTPEPIDLETNGSLVVFYYRPIPGVNLEEVDPVAYDPRRFDAGPLRGAIHRLGRADALAEVYAPSLQDHWDLAQRYVTALTKSGLAFSPEVVAQLASDFSRAEQPFTGFPTVFIHGDLHASNVLRLPDGRVGVIDWEFARRGHALEDCAALVLERAAMGEDLHDLTREIQGTNPQHAELVPPVLRALVMKQLLKRLVFARIRRADPVLEGDYMRVFELATGTEVGVRSGLELRSDRARSSSARHSLT